MIYLVAAGVGFGVAIAILSLAITVLAWSQIMNRLDEKEDGTWNKNA